jgi:hypothetical protein
MSNTKDNEQTNEESRARRPEARSQQPNLPTSIMGPGGDYEPPASTPGTGSGGSTGGGSTGG